LPLSNLQAKYSALIGWGSVEAMVVDMELKIRLSESITLIEYFILFSCINLNRLIMVANLELSYHYLVYWTDYAGEI
jgi:hypothetical protein